MDLRIGTWVLGSRIEAESACCEDENCGGFHLDKLSEDFVLLTNIGYRSEDTWSRRECWKKVTQNGEDVNSTDVKSVAVNSEDSRSAPSLPFPLRAVMAAAALPLVAAGV
uniref:Uncharacterized protein n=1 Tax=Pyrodinium bahamense TaxID=73915 RepID=A0A7S0A8C3_9DINO